MTAGQCTLSPPHQPKGASFAPAHIISFISAEVKNHALHVIIIPVSSTELTVIYKALGYLDFMIIIDNGYPLFLCSRLRLFCMGLRYKCFS